jgi:hypothetical protein
MINKRLSMIASIDRRYSHINELAAHGNSVTVSPVYGKHPPCTTSDLRDVPSSTGSPTDYAHVAPLFIDTRVSPWHGERWLVSRNACSLSTEH